MHNSEEYFSRLKVTVLTLYWVKMTHYRTKEAFYKVGVTSGTLDKRFDEDLERFDIEVIKTKVLPMHKAVKAEATILKRMEDTGRTYKPKVHFNGSTECFI